MSSMIASVICSSTALFGVAPAQRDRSTGSPAVTVTGMRGLIFSLLVRGSKTCWAPQFATGTTGAPVIRARRAAPVLPRMGHRSASRVVVPTLPRSTGICWTLCRNGPSTGNRHRLALPRKHGHRPAR